ncbi:Zinc transporter [Phytophthora boehmeriae]|uniref:Zinc transporter n=1 Tax=Phytophthora boehmeriae TaxID=109152 RepID=A0A8T1WZH1_9STRA|nr:Zinc transporter [Phytophthora boehmeriae]
MGETELYVAAAFQLNAVAAVATVVGGLVICSNHTLRLATPKALATTLSISGGVTLFLSLMVVFGYSTIEFARHFRDSADTIVGKSWVASTLCLGVGIIIVYSVGFVVEKLTPGVDPQTPKQPVYSNVRESQQGNMQESVYLASPQDEGFIKMDETAKQKLQQMGVLSAIAIALHNIPSGIATFTASVEHPRIGLAMVMGVGLHNIAEGVAIAAPVYFATGSKKRGIMWCLIACIAEHLGAFIAFGIVGKEENNFTEGIVYGIVAGMMATTAMKEIFPTAYMYANGRIHLVSNGGLLGMVLMAISLSFFKHNQEQAIMMEKEMHVATAFQLNVAAALATVVGGLVICSQRTLRLATPMALATTLGISGGVTIFLSLMVLLGYSVLEFSITFDDNTDETNTGLSWLAATICLGIGIVIVYCVDYVVQKLTPAADSQTPKQSTGSDARESPQPHPLENVYIASPPQDHGFIRMNEAAKEKLQQMGILSGIAIALHNIPSGIATFTAGVEHPSVGLAMAIGVGLHNLAEGVAVAAPVYFATGSKCKGIAWCIVAAVAEHFGAFIAFAAVNDDGHSHEAALYGIVAGMMTTTTLKEIFPTAYVYANGRVHLVSSGVLIGMILMATGLSFFQYVGV